MTVKRSLLWLGAALAAAAFCWIGVFIAVEAIESHEQALRHEHAEERCTNTIELPERIVVEGHNYTCDADGYAVEELPFRRGNEHR